MIEFYWKDAIQQIAKFEAINLILKNYSVIIRDMNEERFVILMQNTCLQD